MKNSSASRSVRALLAGLALAWGTAARAGAADEGLACIDAADLACAEAALPRAGGGTAADLLRARVAFHRAEFADAVKAMERAVQGAPSGSPLREELEHMRVTLRAVDGMRVLRRGDVEVRYADGVDLVLLDEAVETLQAAHDRIAPRLGGAPPGPIRVEIYPSAERFIAASGIPAEAVRTTGVVALSKWSRLLLTSPRGLGRGYAWRDTLAHEYLHLVVAWRSRDQTPVWLQEGIARSHEVLWHEDTFAPLAPHAESLLARALANDTLVPLAKMHPSMAFLPSADEAALAYAQVGTMVEYLSSTVGKDALSRVLDRVRTGTDALEAVAGVAGQAPDAFMDAWRTDLRQRRLVARGIAAAPTVLGPADDAYGVDPLLAKRKDLAGFARLGDLLLAAGKPEAALAEYAKALGGAEEGSSTPPPLHGARTPPPGVSNADEPPSPLVVARRAEALRQLGRVDEAITSLQASVRAYPEFPATRKALAALLLARGKSTPALAEYRAAADVNPFDPVVQTALADLYARSGASALAERHARYRRILDLGGAPPSEPPTRAAAPAAPTGASE